MLRTVQWLDVLGMTAFVFGLMLVPSSGYAETGSPQAQAAAIPDCDLVKASYKSYRPIFGIPGSMPEAQSPKPLAEQTSPPQIIYSVDPQFPAGISKQNGRAVVEILIDADGIPQDVHVVCVSGNPAFGENAVKAVKQYRFKPASLKGKPVPVKINIETNFLFR